MGDPRVAGARVVGVGRRVPAAVAICAAILLPLVQPAAAAADSGSTAAVATGSIDTVDSVPAGVQVKVVDGQSLWMRVDPRLTVVVIGLRGEPFLRFSPAGVDENMHAPSAYLDRGLPQAVPAGFTAASPPLWRPVSSAHAYMWHENRLQPAVPAGAGGTAAAWTVPLTVNGAPARIGGELLHRPAPSRLWLWPLVVALACAAAAVRLGCDVARPAARVTAVLVLPAIVAGRLGRELYGHPGLSTWQVADVAITCVLGVVLAHGLIRRRQVQLATLVTGAWALYEGAFLLPALTRGYVLAALPATIERLAASACLAGGAAILLASVVFELPAVPRPRIAPPQPDIREHHASG